MEDTFGYYERMKALARKVRDEHGLKTPRVLRSDLRRIYKAYGIKIDLWCHKLKHLRGAFIFDDLGPTVMLYKNLPECPMIFTMGHELKHFLEDRHLKLSYCDPSNERAPIEIGAEVFAAELIYPEQDFAGHMKEMGIGRGQCVAESLVRLKHETRTTLSYAGLVKRAERFQFAPKAVLSKVKWVKLEEETYGLPFYKQRHLTH